MKSHVSIWQCKIDIQGRFKPCPWSQVMPRLYTNVFYVFEVNILTLSGSITWDFTVGILSKWFWSAMSENGGIMAVSIKTRVDCITFHCTFSQSCIFCLTPVLTMFDPIVLHSPGQITGEVITLSLVHTCHKHSPAKCKKIKVLFADTKGSAYSKEQPHYYMIS